MRKWVITGAVFTLGLFLGLILMASLCDQFVGKWLSKSTTHARFPTYSVKVAGAIITKATPCRLYLRSIDLNSSIFFKKPEGSLGNPILMEIDNLPKGFKVSYTGNIPETRSRGETSLALIFPSSKKGFNTTIKIAPPLTSSHFTFWVAGDNRDRLDLLETLLRKAKGKSPLFMVLGGDMVGHGLFWQYRRLITSLDASPIPVYPVPGNHDLEFCGRRSFTRLLAPDHYAFSYGNSLFVVLDTNGKEMGQIEWLDKVLSSHRYAHRFVFAHKPPFDPRPKSRHCMHQQRFAQRLLKVLVKQKVDVLFCSHIHSFIETRYKGVKIVITGGLGAHRKDPIKPFHYVEVEVAPSQVKVKAKRIM